jgi:murein DD-endopeptidase MepM/ murein hydrolase activator NlpD
MDQAEKRITRKTFGMYITPENSPVQPDKFRGFHAGTDWEVFPDELAGDVPVRAVCSGNLKLKKTASGYGGVAVQQCDLDGQEITVIYGHMKLSSITTETGGFVSAGKVLGLLGDDKSPETDGARKHLHLAFHLGGKIDIKGYLAENKDLENWLDPCDYICK